jgi:hypothetical protein
MVGPQSFESMTDRRSPIARSIGRWSPHSMPASGG